MQTAAVEVDMAAVAGATVAAAVHPDMWPDAASPGVVKAAAAAAMPAAWAARHLQLLTNLAAHSNASLQLSHPGKNSRCLLVLIGLVAAAAGAGAAVLVAARALGCSQLCR
jgi:hypothetical protein